MGGPSSSSRHASGINLDNFWQTHSYKIRESLPTRMSRRYLYRLYLGFTLCLFGALFYLFEQQTTTVSMNRLSPSSQQSANLPITLDSPFTGAFARFPRVSALPQRQRRITIVGMWDDDNFPTYLRHFFYTIQLNADVLDLLMINRLSSADSHCLDFEKAGVNITWGGNVKVACMDDKEWKHRHVDFLCSSKYGWNCSPTEYGEVLKELIDRNDLNNYWRPFRGHVFRDLFANPNNPFWAWMDHDVVVGNFAHYPFNILSQLSILTATESIPEDVFMAGQLTAFNLDDEALGTAWKKFPSMKTATHFTRHLEGKMPRSSEEKWWSYGYLRSDDDLPGSELSYAVYPDIHGDDYYDRRWNRQNSQQIYLVSGRTVLLASTTYTRPEIERLIRMDRDDPIDDLGGIGWTGGEDGSAYLVDQPTLDSSEAKLLAMSESRPSYQSRQLHDGIVEDQLLLTDNCTASNGNFVPKPWRQCVHPHPLTVSNPPIMRASLVHFKEQRPGHLLRRLEKDRRPRGYERKLFKHNFKLKKQDWFDFPPFDITEDLVFRYNSDVAEVFRMGSSREETLFYRNRQPGTKSIG